MSIRKSNSLASQPTFLVVASAVFMTNLDLWIVNVAFDDIAGSFGGSSLSALSWVLNAYAVALAALLVVGGRLGDRFGHRDVFLLGTAVFTIASLACALAPNLGILVAARVLQATGAALQLPTSLALLLASVPADRRLGAARAWAAVGGLSAAAGPVIGGLLVQADWRWVFVVNLPIGVAGVIAGLRVLPRVTAATHLPLPDLAGSVLLTVGVAALTAGVVQGPEWGWSSGGVLGLFVVSVVALAWFANRCTSHAAPLVEPVLLRARGFVVSTLALFVFSIAFAIMLLSNALWCQGVWGYSALQTGLAMAPGPALVPVVTVLTGRLVSRVGPGRVAALGSVLFAASFLWRAAVAETTPNYLVDLLPSMVFGGIGVGMALGTLMAVGATSVPADRSATGSAVMNTSRQIASSIGVALLVTILSSSAPNDVGAFRASWLLAAALTLAAAAGALLIRPAAASAVVRIRGPRDMAPVHVPGSGA